MTTELLWSRLKRSQGILRTLVCGLLAIAACRDVDYLAAPEQPPAQAVVSADMALIGDPTPSLVVTSSSTVALWKMHGPAYSGYQYTPLDIPDWRVVGAADLNGDNQPDLVWEKPANGLRAVTFMTGPAYGGSYAIPFIIPPEWHIVSATDFDANGKPDIVLANEVTGDCGVLYLDGVTWTGVFSALPKYSTNLKLVAVGDLNSDTHPDLVWQDTLTGEPTFTLLDGTTPIASAAMPSLLPPSPSWRISVVADFDGDGSTDLELSNRADGSQRIWHLRNFDRIGESFLPTLAPSYRVVAAAPISWAHIPRVYFADTGHPTSDSTGWDLRAGGSSTCLPQPSCAGNYQLLGTRFVLASAARLDLIEIWMRGGGGSIFVNIRADNAGLPGTVIRSKGFFLGSYQVPMWIPFATYFLDLGPGTYWVTLEPIAFSGMQALVPVGPPQPLAAYAQLNNTLELWHSAPPAGFGVRISGRP